MKGLNVVLPLLCLTVTALAPAAVTAQGPSDCVTCADGQLDVCKDADQNPHGWAHWAWDLNNAGQTHIRNEGTERNAIQVESCDEGFIAVHIPLGHYAPAALATASIRVAGSRSEPKGSAGKGEPK